MIYQLHNLSLLANIIEVTADSVEMEALDGDGAVGGEEDGAVDDGVGAEAHLLHEPVVVRRQGELRDRRQRGPAHAPAPHHRRRLGLGWAGVRERRRRGR